MGNDRETIPGSFRIVEIAPGQSIPTDIEHPGFPIRNRLQMLIQNMDLCPVDRLANGNIALGQVV